MVGNGGGNINNSTCESMIGNGGGNINNSTCESLW